MKKSGDIHIPLRIKMGAVEIWYWFCRILGVNLKDFGLNDCEGEKELTLRKHFIQFGVA